MYKKNKNYENFNFLVALDGTYYSHLVCVWFQFWAVRISQKKLPLVIGYMHFWKLILWPPHPWTPTCYKIIWQNDETLKPCAEIKIWNINLPSFNKPDFYANLLFQLCNKHIVWILHDIRSIEHLVTNMNIFTRYIWFPVKSDRIKWCLYRSKSLKYLQLRQITAF